MSEPAASLPDDPAALKAMLAAREAEIDRLYQIIRELQRHRFWAAGREPAGRPASSGPRGGRAGEAEGFAREEAADPAKREVRARRRRANRGALPAHLPRIEQVIDIADKSCPGCRGQLHVMGEDVSERLDMVPAQFRVIVTRRPKYACRRCHSSDRGTRALARMNAIHGRFRIANADFLYVLSTFVFEPIRWNARFGWRPLCPTERLAYFHFWREVGRRMGLADLPDDYDAFERFNRHYEARHFRFTDANAHGGGATVALFAGWAPRPLAPFVRRAIYALLDEPCRAAFGFPRPRPPSAGWPAARCGCAPGSRASCPRAAAPACAPRPRTRPIPPATRSRRSAPADRPTRRSRSPLRPRLEAHRPFP